MANVKVDLRGAQKKLSSQNLTRGKVAMANQALMDMDRYVPLETNALRASGHVTDGGNAVEYNTPYARAQFYGSTFSRGVTRTWSKGKEAGTGPRWDLKAKGIHGKNWPQTFKKGAGL